MIHSDPWKNLEGQNSEVWLDGILKSAEIVFEVTSDRNSIGVQGMWGEIQNYVNCRV